MYFGTPRTSDLKTYYFNPKNLKLLHQRNEDDYDRRLQFLEKMGERVNSKSNFL